MALTDKLTAIANAIRSKTGKTGTLTLDQMASEVSNISTGLDDSKLASATATEADVLSGLTFYSGDKELKTGTASLKLVATRCATWDGSDVGYTFTKDYKNVIIACGYSAPADSNVSVSVSATSGTLTKIEGNTYFMKGSLWASAAYAVYSLVNVTANSSVTVTTSNNFSYNTTFAYLHIFTVE